MSFHRQTPPAAAAAAAAAPGASDGSSPSAVPAPGVAPGLTSRGVFIAFEGGDGAGKSTQVAAVQRLLQAAGRTVLRTREPGGTPVGEKLRALVLEHGHGSIDARTEALIFAASRAAHVDQVIRPALERGEIVLCDRYMDSSIAYQGAGRGLGLEAVRDLNLWATGLLRPDVTVLLDVEPGLGRERRLAGDAGEDRLESESDAFHARIRSAFRELAAADPEHYLVLDAGGGREELTAAIMDRIAELLP